MTIAFDLAKVDELHGRLVRMAKVDTKKTMRKFWSASLSDVEDKLKEKIDRLFPHGRRKSSGMLRKKKYGPLSEDVSKKIWSKGGGGVIYIFRNNQGRQCVLRWLDAGTNDRGDQRSLYGDKGAFIDYSSSGNGIGAGFRSRIAPRNFFVPTVEDASFSIIQQRVDEVSKQIVNEIIKQGQ